MDEREPAADPCVHPVPGVTIETRTVMTCTHCQQQVLIMYNGGPEMGTRENALAKWLNQSVLQQFHEARGAHAFEQYRQGKYTMLCPCGARA